MPLTTSSIESPTVPAIAELKQLDPTAQQQEAVPPDSYFDFTWARTRFDKIISEWKTIRDETERMRLMRYMKTDKLTLQRIGLFKEDELYIAVRLIDQNIRAEQPQRLAYITQPRRAVILKPSYSVGVTGVENLESVFTDCARYVSWETPFIKVDDGASTHGWDFVEVVFDPTKPGHFAIEHVGHENLMFDLETEDINSQEVLGRVIKVSAGQLRKYVREFGFNPEIVQQLLDQDQKNENKTKDAVYSVFKFFFRYNDAIYVCWYGGERTQDFLSKPLALYLGVNNLKLPGAPRVAETSYPFFELDYIETEAPKIIDKKGRAYLDEPAQEGASALLSSIVNGNMRASNVYGCVKQGPVPSADTAAPKQTDIKLRHGMIYDKELSFFSTPYPPESAIQALEMTTQYNKLDISRPDYAVKNRKDSRKTATEVAASVNDASMQASVQSTQQSVFMRKVYTKCFEIFQNRCQQGLIPIQDQQVQQLLQLTYDVKAAGDVDVIQRNEKLQKQQQAWPVVAATPLAIPFLIDYLINAFPEEGPKYAQVLMQEMQGKQLVAGLSAALKAAITTPEGQIKPEFQHEVPQLQQLAGQVQQYLGAGSPEQQQNDQQPTTTTAETGGS